MAVSRKEQLTQAARFLEKQLAPLPDTLVVLGSGLGHYAEKSEIRRLAYQDIPHFPVSTVAGHAGALCVVQSVGRDILVMRGRCHLYEGYSPHQVTLPLRALALCGVKNLVLTNAAGAVNSDFTPGDLVLIKDHINLFGITPLTGENIDALGSRFVDMTQAYDRALRKKLAREARLHGLRTKKGIYMYFPGPQYETPAEIRAARALGADLVGMSTVAEAIAAAHAGMRTLAVSCVTNMAAGISGAAISHDEVTQVGGAAADKFSQLLDIAITVF